MTTYSQTCLNPGYKLQLLRSFKLGKDSLYNSDKKEIEFIHINNHDIIADIGSFNGYYPLIYSIFSDSCVFYANDIQQSGFAYYDSMKTICEQIRGSSFTNKINIVIGNDSSTQLPDHLFSKVIVRDALHHFKMKDKMLVDIKRIMNPVEDAKLLLFEPIRGQTNENDLCPGAMTKKELLELLDTNGFKFLKEIEVGDRSWLEFALKNAQ